MNVNGGADDEYEDDYEEIVDDIPPQPEGRSSKRSGKPRPASNRGRPAQP